MSLPFWVGLFKCKALSPTKLLRSKICYSPSGFTLEAACAKDMLIQSQAHNSLYFKTFFFSQGFRYFNLHNYICCPLIISPMGYLFVCQSNSTGLVFESSDRPKIQFSWFSPFFLLLSVKHTIYTSK